jgi:hypothetical protein
VTPRSGRPAAAGESTAWRVLFWLVPLALAAVQWRLSTLSTHQIRYEELAESVRNVFWLDNRLVYDGISSNVGWYGTLLASYKIVGFSLATAKYVRVVLSLIGLVCVADLLRRGLDMRRAIVPLVVFGLSPTLLYLNTLQTSYGVDLPYAAICLWLVLSVRRGAIDLAKLFACGVLAMTAAMSYPTFMLYLPSLVLVWIWWTGHDAARSAKGMAAQALAGVLGLALPLGLAFIWLRNPGLLVYDAATHAGLFRGGARIGLDWTVLTQSIGTVFGDLFGHGQSYYFEVTRPDYAGPLAILGLIGVLATAVYLGVTKPADRMLLAAAGLLLVLSLIVPNLSIGGPPGIRRCTGLVAAVFVTYALAWRFFATMPRNGALRWAGLAICLLAPLDSALKLPSLQDDALADSAYKDGEWFAIESTPAQSLARLLAQLDQGQGLACPVDQERRILPCRYQEIYAAMAGSRRWNRLPPKDISALDWKTGQTITLTPSLWTDYYFPH